MNDIEQIRRQRFQFLRFVFDKTGGDEYKDVDIQIVGNELGFSPDTTNLIEQYLYREGLIKPFGLGTIAITHKGLVEIEIALANPNAQTVYFPPVVNIYSGDFRGAILNVDSSLKNVTQNVGAMMSIDDTTKEKLQRLLDELDSTLKNVPSEQSDDAEAVVWATRLMVDAATNEKKNQTKIEITKDGLLKAAENIASVTPLVLKIAKEIISTIGI